MSKRENAVEYKHNGFNCCQAVLAAYKDELGISEEMTKRLGAGFGGGMGCMEGTCGALCGAEMIMGLTEYNGFPVTKQARDMHTAFKAKCGATICRDLKQMTDGKPLCSCDDCVRHAVDIVEENLQR